MFCWLQFLIHLFNWSLFSVTIIIRLLDDEWSEQATHLYMYSFTEHRLRVTDIVIGYGGWNSVIVSASEDRTCKVKQRLCYDLSLLNIIMYQTISRVISHWKYVVSMLLRDRSPDHTCSKNMFLI